MTAKERLAQLEKDKVRYEALSESAVQKLDEIVAQIKTEFNIEPEEIDAHALTLQFQLEKEEEELTKAIEDRHRQVTDAYQAIR